MAGKRGILFVHGIVGNNQIFDFLKPLIGSDDIVRYVFLEGHRGNALDFSRATMSRWKAQVKDAIDEMSSLCDMVIGVGHSMGCLLLMEQASLPKMRGLLLLNPPLRIRLRFTLIKNAIKVMMGQGKDDPVIQAAQDAYGVSIDFNPFHYYGWPARYAELFVEIRRVREKVLPYITIPIKSFLSRKDELVALASKRYIDTLPNASTVVLEGSTHYY
ncbi:MAG: alpha/beta fold hydrolase, partial [Muribaculaceae bacterium]|nr:alpha/beta fold hydrolase [Muribaculaceae bacterium]